MSNMQVIKASAGSGKTYTLARRFLEEMLFDTSKTPYELRGRKDYFEHIMAITFTNKATNEMKNRIVDELHKLAKDATKSDYYKNEWTDSCSKEALAGVQQAARDGLACILFNYSAFKVSTIDSFFQSILRSFARELDRDYNYDLMLDGDYAAAVAANKFLLSLGHDTQRTGSHESQVESWVKDYIRSQVSDKKSWNSIFGTSSNSLAGFAKKINNEFFRENLPTLRLYLTGTGSSNNLERIKKLCDLFKDKAKEYEIKFKDIDYWKSKITSAVKDPGKTLVYALKGLATKPDYTWPQDMSTLRKHVDDAIYFIAKPQKSIIAPTILDSLNNTIKEILKCYDYWQLLSDMASKLSFVGLMGEINKKLEDYREESNTVLIADTNELIGKVVETSSTPFIYERISTWINHFMLDEFQDTSKKQYSNFLPLLLESLSNDNKNLVIGDTKQAIYRFRNADPSLFRDEIDKDFASHIATETLATNWRSNKSVIDFNNSFIKRFLSYFGDIEKESEKYPYKKLLKTYMPTGNKKDYFQEISGPKSKEAPGLVRVNFGYKKEENNGETGEETIPFKEVDDVLPYLTEHLKDMGERFGWSNINILVNKKKEGKAVVAHLLDYNKNHPDEMIPIVSGELMRLDQSNAVRRLVNMLQFIDLTSFALSEDGMEEITTQEKEEQNYANLRRMKQQRQFRALELFTERLSDHDEMQEEDAGNLLIECFAEIDQLAGEDEKEQMSNYANDLNSRLPDKHKQTMNLVNIVETLIKKSVKDIERKMDNIFLQAFLNCVIDFSSKRNGGTIREFLKHWEQNKDKITVPDSGNSDAIKVYTIHSSKGLEADCVVIPCADWDLDTNSMDKEYWMTGKEWLADGGRQMLDEIASGEWEEEWISPILSANKTKLHNMMSHNMFTDVCTSRDEDLLIDNVNKTYVAFTRPRKELHIYSVGGPRGKDAKTTSINHVLEDVVKKTEDGWFKSKDNLQYDLGEPYPKKVDDNKDKTKYENKPMPDYHVSVTQVDVDLPSDSDLPREMGKRLHLLMSRINYSSQIEKALSYCERRGIIGKNNDNITADLLEGFLREKMAVEPYASWFALDNKVYTERPLHVKGEGNKRPDRIVQRPDGSYIIIDYKFAQHTEANDDAYKTQVREYMEALGKTTTHPIQGFLWYINTNENGDNGITDKVIEVK